MSSSSSYAPWSLPRSRSPHGSFELADESFSESSSIYSALVSPDCDSEDEEFHEEEFSGILALAELARVSFASSSSTGDLEDYIAYLRDALTVAPREGQARAEILNTLAHNLYLSVTQACTLTADLLERLDESVHFHRLALHYLPTENEARGIYISQFAVVLRERFFRSGNQQDLDQCISLHSQALRLRPSGHRDRLESLSSLANANFARYECFDDRTALEHAVRYDREALELSSPHHPNRIPALLALATDLAARFGQCGSQTDFQESIALYQESLQLSTTSQENLHIAQHLASLLFTQYRIGHDVSFLEQAIEVCSTHLRTGEDLPDTARLPVLRLLADLCLTQYSEGSHEARDLENAIQHCMQSLHSLPTISPLSDRLHALMNLSYALASRFCLSRAVEDIDRSILLCTEAVGLSQPGHPQYSCALRALARSYAIRHEYCGDNNDLKHALVRYAEAVEDPYGLVRERIAYGQEWVALLARHNDQSSRLLKAYTSLIFLFRHLVYFEEDPQLRAEDTMAVAHVLSGALQCALDSGDTKKAVELVEQRQEILWCPRRLDDIIPPPLHQRLHSIARELHGSPNDHSLSTPLLHTQKQRGFNHDELACRRRNLVDEFYGLVHHLRQYPGLSDLLQPIPSTELISGWHRGPVILLVAQPCCEAIICQPTAINRISLPLQGDELADLANEFYSMADGITESEYGALSERSWTGIVRPVLNFLGYLEPPMHGPKPRVWWCPTGPFIFIPLHAVGHFQPGKQPACTFDYIVSSYTPSITALRTVERNKVARHSSHIPGLSPIITTGLHPSSYKDSVGKDDTHFVQIPSPISSDGPSYSFGYDIDNPAQGRRAPFIRLTGPLDHSLAVAPHYDPSRTLHSSTYPSPDQINLTSSYVAFAFLHPQYLPVSSTDTPCLPREGSHAGLALFSGGFHSIIGTIPGWQDMLHNADTTAVIEQVCKDIEFMDTSEIDSSIVPYALDKAIRGLRKSGVPFTRFIPFIHIGL